MSVRAAFHPQVRAVWVAALAMLILAPTVRASVFHCPYDLEVAASPGPIPGAVIAGPYLSGSAFIGTVVYTTSGVGIRQGPGQFNPEWFALPGLNPTTLHGISHVYCQPEPDDAGDDYPVGWDELVLCADRTGFPSFVGAYDPVLNTLSGFIAAAPFDTSFILGVNPNACARGMFSIAADSLRLNTFGCVCQAKVRPPGAGPLLTVGPAPTGALATFAAATQTIDLFCAGGNIAIGFLPFNPGPPGQDALPMVRIGIAAPPLWKASRTAGERHNMRYRLEAEEEVEDADSVMNMAGASVGDTILQYTVGVPPNGLVTTSPWLGAPSPNPTPLASFIQYYLPEAGVVDLAIYDVSGRKVYSLVHGERAAGTHPARWNGIRQDGRRVPSGVYTYRLTVAGSPPSTRTVVLVR